MELVEYVFTIPSVTAFLSKRVCQDPLENFFLETTSKRKGERKPLCGKIILEHTGSQNCLFYLCYCTCATVGVQTGGKGRHQLKSIVLY